MKALELSFWISPLVLQPITKGGSKGAAMPRLHKWAALPIEVFSYSLPETGGFLGNVLIIHRNASSFPVSSWSLVLSTIWKWLTQLCFVECKKVFLNNFHLLAFHFLSKSLFLMSENMYKTEQYIFFVICSFETSLLHLSPFFFSCSS